jgi:hypothetical protein
VKQRATAKTRLAEADRRCVRRLRGHGPFPSPPRTGSSWSSERSNRLQVARNMGHFRSPAMRTAPPLPTASAAGRFAAALALLAAFLTDQVAPKDDDDETRTRRFLR